MSFTIIKSLEQIPSYPMLCKLAEQNDLRVIGNEHTGSFSGHGVEGDYKIGEDGINGNFSGHGIAGAFSFDTGKAAVTIANKPFWLPETVLKQKITEALDALLKELA
jgi:hypothetical protein